MTGKVVSDATSALAGLLFDGMTIMSGGFGLCGIPENLIDGDQAGRDQGPDGDLQQLRDRRFRPGRPAGRRPDQEDDLVLCRREQAVRASCICPASWSWSSIPQGTLAERIRAGGAGIPAFFTKTGVGTLVAEGKEVREFDGELYVMERGLTADLSIVKAWKGDAEGNLVYRKTARNFNPMMATAGKATVVEVEELVEVGQLDPDHIHTPGIFVDRLLHGRAFREAHRARDHAAAARGRLRRGGSLTMAWTRDDMAARRGPGAEGRLLRQPRHRHPHAGGQLHPRRHAGDPAERERHARHGSVPL